LKPSVSAVAPAAAPQLNAEPLGGIMIGADALSAFAEIAVGVAGFSAVVVALRPNAVIEDERRRKWGLALLFCWALGSLFFSVLPIILFHAGIAEPITWKVSFYALAAFFVIAGSAIAATDIRLNRIGLDLLGNLAEPPIRPSVQIVIARAIYTGASVSLLSAAIWFPKPGIYLAGLALMLGLSLWTLAVFVFAAGQPTNAA
jgi:hypothetical protein